jgi:hypothetical protein
MLFGIGLAWAQFPDPQPDTDDPAVVASRRAAAVKAATRVIAPTSQPGRAASAGPIRRRK